MDIWDYLFILVIACGGFILLLYNILWYRYHNILLRRSFEKLGFNYSTTHMDFFNKFQIGFPQFLSTTVFSGMYKNQNCWGVFFKTQNYNQGNQHFFGLIIETKEIHESVHIYDTRTAAALEIRLPHKTESIDFDAAFRVFADNAKDVYYALDPVAMHNLLELRRQHPNPLNVQLFDNKVLVYSTASTVMIPYDDVFNTLHILTQNPPEFDTHELSQQIKNEFETYYTFYKSTGL